MLIVNLALFDAVMLLELPMLIGSSFAERMIGWEIGCQLYAALGSVSGIGASITNAAIAYDRYK
jgi:r-opsin